MKEGIRQLWRLPDIGGSRRSQPSSSQYIVGSGGVLLPAYMGAGAGSVIDPSGDPYPWYTSFNRNTVPWNTASGGWGVAVPLVAPAAPVTTRSVSVSSQSAFNTEAAVAGTLITVTGGWSPATTSNITADDIDVIINAGVAIGAIFINNGDTPVRRTRIRGPVIGEHSGGLMGQIRNRESGEDLILDGIDLNGDSGFDTGETNQSFRLSGTRIAVVNVRSISAGYGWLGSAHQVVIANSNIFHGAATRANVDYDEGWGIRNSAGPFTIIDSRIQGTRYHPLRMHSEGNSGELLYSSGSTYASQCEGKLVWMWNTVPIAHAHLGQAAILDDCDFYSYQNATCGSGDANMSCVDVGYSRVMNSRTWYAGTSTSSQSYFNSCAAAGGTPPGDHDWDINNSFASFSSYPSWGGPGDPTSIPLPSGMVFANGEGLCPYGP